MYHVLRNHVTRRRSIAVITTAALGVAGLAIAPGRSRAAVTLDIESRTFTPEDGQVYRPWIVASGGYEYSNLDTEAAEAQTYLLVDGPDATGEDWQAIAVADRSVSGTQGSGEYALRGAITSSSAWERSHFTSDGDPLTVSVPTAIMFLLRDSGGDVLADAEAHTEAEVTVEHGGAVVSISGTGTVDAQLTPDDPTPTLAGGA